jgi:hypothetical protein
MFALDDTREATPRSATRPRKQGEDDRVERPRAIPPSWDDSVGREFNCAADLVGVQGVRREHIETKYVSAEQRSTTAKTKQMNRDAD